MLTVMRCSKRWSDIQACSYVSIVFTLLFSLSQDATVTGNVAMILTTLNKSEKRLLNPLVGNILSNIGMQSHVCGIWIALSSSALSFSFK